MPAYADLRDAFWQSWELIAQGSQANPTTCRETAARVAAAEAAVGEYPALALRTSVADEWRGFHHSNPYTGEPLDPAPAVARPEPLPADPDEAARAWRNAAWAKP